jgi:hypothetical protein
MIIKAMLEYFIEKKRKKKTAHRTAKIQTSRSYLAH